MDLASCGSSRRARVDTSGARLAFSVVAAALTLTTAQGAASAASFVGLGLLDGLSAYPSDISDDGSAVVGNTSIFPTRAFRWTAADGLVELDALAGPGQSVVANAVSADGSRIVGGRDGRGWVWDGDAGSSAALGPLGFSSADGISPDGATIVGQLSTSLTFEAYRSSAATGTQLLGVFDPSWPISRAFDASAGGAVVVGTVDRRQGVTSAFVWTEATGMTVLPDLPGGGIASAAWAVSSDGSTVVGWSRSSLGLEPVLWDSSGAIVGLGSIPGVAPTGGAFGVSADGSVIVGVAGSTATAAGPHAFVWDRQRGMRTVESVLTSAGIDLEGWKLTSARAISADGLSIAGAGINPSGQAEAWLAVIPEPSSGAMVAAGVLALACRRQHRSRNEKGPG